MKFVVVQLPKGPDGTFQYPPAWNARRIEREKRGALLYRLRSDPAEVIVVLPDAYADELLVQSPNASELSEAAADDWVATTLADQTVEVVNDADRLLAIIAKNAAGQALSAEDRKAVDPSDPTPGIVRIPKTARARLRIA